jgi:hypothetical protein
MFVIRIEWCILNALIVVTALTALRSFMNGVRILRAESTDTRNSARKLNVREILREPKVITYIIEGLESNYDGFVLKKRVYSAGHQE